MSKWVILLPLFLGIFLLGNKCTPDPGHEQHLLDKIRAHQEEFNYELATNLLDTTLLLKVHAGLPAVTDFFTEKRAHQITSFPCTNCHSKSLKQMQTGRPEEVRKAHWNIHLVHAKGEVMNCTTCHAGKNMDHLVSLTGELFDINESFKLCGQCHSSQLKDWEGGAHGKQLNGWKPPRVAKTCVSCHNPHQPAFPNRFPARLNTNDLGD